MHGPAAAILLALALVAVASGPSHGQEKLCLYQPGVPKPAASPGPSARPLLVTAQAEAVNDAAARTEAQLAWSRRVQASFGPAFAVLGKARNPVNACRDAGGYLSTGRSCSVQAQPCN